MLDFGSIDISGAAPSDKELELTITNIGTADLEITEIKITNIVPVASRINNTRAVAIPNSYTCPLDIPTTISPSSSKKTKIILNATTINSAFNAKLEIKTNGGTKTISLKANITDEPY